MIFSLKVKKLNEGELHRIIQESVNNIFKKSKYQTYEQVEKAVI